MLALVASDSTIAVVLFTVNLSTRSRQCQSPVIAGMEYEQDQRKELWLCQTMYPNYEALEMIFSDY